MWTYVKRSLGTRRLYNNYTINLCCIYTLKCLSKRDSYIMLLYYISSVAIQCYRTTYYGAWYHLIFVKGQYDLCGVLGQPH